MPTWIEVNDSTFGGGDTTVGAAGNTTSVGSGWIDVWGSNWHLSGGHAVADGAGDFQSCELVRPFTEATTDQKIVVTFEANSGSWAIDLRRTSTGTVTSARYVILNVTGGCQVYPSPALGSYGSPTNWSIAGWDTTHRYRVTATAVGTSPTTITCQVDDLTTATDNVGSVSLTDSTSAMQTAGVTGVSKTGGGDHPVVSEVVTYAGSAPVLSSGTLYLSSASASSVVLAYTGTTGGTSPYTEKLHRSLTSGFMPDVGTVLASAPTYPYTDTPPDTQVYYYKHQAVDSAGTPATVTTTETPGRRLSASLKIGFVGDSITYGAGLTPGTNDPGTVCGGNLARLGTYRAVTVVNKGYSGSLTANWLPAAAPMSGGPVDNLLTDAKAAFLAAGVTVVHLMLGTNDGYYGASTGTSQANLAAICADLTAAGYTVLVSYPPCIVPGVAPSYAEPGNALLQALQPVIDGLVSPPTVYQGDTLAFDYFANNPSEVQADGLHPTAAGAATLGLLWSRSVDRALTVTAGGVAVKTNHFYPRRGR